MKLILTKKEIDAINEVVADVVENINTIDPSANAKGMTIKEIVSTLKNNMVVKFKLFKGFEISFDEVFVSDFIKMYGKVINIWLPTVKACFDLVQTIKPIHADTNDLIENFVTLYAKQLYTETHEVIVVDEEESNLEDLKEQQEQEAQTTCRCHACCTPTDEFPSTLF